MHIYLLLSPSISTSLSVHHSVTIEISPNNSSLSPSIGIELLYISLHHITSHRITSHSGLYHTTNPSFRHRGYVQSGKHFRRFPFRFWRSFFSDGGFGGFLLDRLGTGLGIAWHGNRRSRFRRVIGFFAGVCHGVAL
ncbi:hypothetical protein EX30DRAFT_222554 [Ascodesmis nigricans]|uniref:Uncharacterized protein n=1 Tax=Ascodesmis nigricans TaxID=341454 RepID=A0A4S2MJM1_9PEZI|nr:hypothetical protein EX30DRAFT_222554 [Ascodesmis nigricans]